MNATWNMLQTWIDESQMIMNDLYVRQAAGDAAALEELTAKGDAVVKLVARCRDNAVGL